MRGGAGLVVFLGQRFRRLAIRGHSRRETEPDARARQQPNPLTKAHDRIEHDPGGARECGAHRAPRARRRPARPRKRARSVSHSTGPCGRPSRLKAWNAQSPASSASRGRRWQMSAALSGRVFGFDEQLAEGRMGQIAHGGSQNQFRVAGQLDFANAQSMVAHRDPAHFHVVFGGHRDIELCGQIVVAPAEGTRSAEKMTE